MFPADCANAVGTGQPRRLRGLVAAAGDPSVLGDVGRAGCRPPVICVNWTQTQSGCGASASGIARWSRTAAGPTRPRSRPETAMMLSTRRDLSCSQHVHSAYTLSQMPTGSGPAPARLGNTPSTLFRSKSDLRRLLSSHLFSLLIIVPFCFGFFFFFFICDQRNIPKFPKPP